MSIFASLMATKAFDMNKIMYAQKVFKNQLCIFIRKFALACLYHPESWTMFIHPTKRTAMYFQINCHATHQFIFLGYASSGLNNP